MTIAHRLTPEDVATGRTPVTVGHTTVMLSDHGRSALEDMLATLAAGTCVDLTPVPDLLSTQEAADLLHVSRPTLVKMLEDGLLPYDRPGSHRRVPRAAIDVYLAAGPARRSPALDDFAQATPLAGPDEFVPTR